MRLGDLSVGVLEQIGAVAMQYARTAREQRRRVATGRESLARRLDADELHCSMRQIRVEDSHRIRAAAHASDYHVGLPSGKLWHLRQALLADHALEIAHHHRVRMRSRDAADDVE